MSVSRDGTSSVWNTEELSRGQQAGKGPIGQEPTITWEIDPPVPVVSVAGRTRAARFVRFGPDISVLPFAQALETVFLDNQLRPVAFYPSSLDRLTLDASQQTWAGSEDYGEVLHLVSLAHAHGSM